MRSKRNYKEFAQMRFEKLHLQLRYNENYEELLTKDFDLMRLSEYNWSTYNNYKYDSIGNWTQRTRITNIIGYPGTLRIKEKREIEYY